jgi:periplasmic protein TonB
VFEQIVLPKERTNRVWSVAAALVGQLAIVGVLILVPMLRVEPLPMPEMNAVLLAPPPPPPPPAARENRQIARVVPRHLEASRIFEPRAIPKVIAMIHDLPAPPAAPGVVGGMPGGVVGGQIGGVLGGILNSVPSAAPPPPLQVRHVAPPAPPEEIRVGGDVEAARLVSAPKPPYPILAKEARVQGTVRLAAVIGKDGHIESLAAVAGSPLLINAAVHAVKQWVYRPTYLDGHPVQVDTEIDVTFQLST